MTQSRRPADSRGAFLNDKFRSLGCELIGMSVDQVFAHIKSKGLSADGRAFTRRSRPAP